MTEQTIKWQVALSVLKSQITHIGNNPNFRKETVILSKRSPVSSEILIVMIDSCMKIPAPAQQAVKIGNNILGIMRKDISTNT